MRFTRLDSGVYRADGAEHCYRIMREGKYWRLDIHRWLHVTPSCVIAGERVDVSCDATLTLAKAVASAYETAAGGRRLSVAVQRVYSEGAS